MSTKRLFLAAAAISALTATASADSLDVDFVNIGLGRNVGVHLYGGNMNVFAGQLNHNFSNGEGLAAGLDGDYITFCTELTQYVSKNPSEYELVGLEQAPNSGPMGEVRAQALRELFAYADGAQYTKESSSHNKSFAAAFQVAVWEIVYDYDGDLASLDIADGDLTITGTNNGVLNASVAAILAELLGTIGSGASFPSLFAVSAPNFQDQLVMIPLPAPLAIGLVGLAGVIWRRKKLARLVS